MADTTEPDVGGSGRRAVIINADDFGMSAAINRGIMEAVAAGSVTSASLMVGMPAFEDAVQLARRAGASLGVGLHLTLTVGRPLTHAESLVDVETGEFLPLPRLFARALTGRIRSGDVAAECRAQIARARGAGVNLTHLDGHLHVHLMPAVASVVRQVVATERIPVVRRPIDPLFGVPLWWRRIPQRLVIGLFAAGARVRRWPAATVDHFVGSILVGANDFEAALIRVLDTLPVGVTELMVHPGYTGAPLPGNDAYDHQREAELRALTSPAVLDRLHAGHVKVVNFRTGIARC